MSDICPHCGSSDLDQPAAGAIAHCVKCGGPVDATRNQAFAAAAVQSPEFDDLDDVLRDTAAPLNDIDDILSEVRIPKEDASGKKRGGLLVPLGLTALGLAVAGLLVFALGKIAEFADEPTINKAATASGAAQPPEKGVEPSDPSSEVAPLDLTWTPDSEWLAQLGPPVSLGEYELQLPQDYTRV
ncbi:MAG TPA: hypothetical protein VHB99_10435, partial [Pirellulales bacterium]|nr:hypothetical protein [Pirellulales bacterium]